jgi:transposase-like protein
MSSEVMISVPAEFAAEILARAKSSGHSVAETVRQFAVSVHQQPSPSMNEWTDDQVSAAAALKLPLHDSERISELLDKQQACEISPTESDELRNLLACYQALQLYQARALGEAIRRGLRSAPVIGS